MRANASKWATEAEAIAVFGLEEVGHCETCHARALRGERMVFEVTLPDGRVAEVCCTVGINALIG